MVGQDLQMLEGTVACVNVAVADLGCVKMVLFGRIRPAAVRFNSPH